MITYHEETQEVQVLEFTMRTALKMNTFNQVTYSLFKRCQPCCLHSYHKERILHARKKYI